MRWSIHALLLLLLAISALGCGSGSQSPTAPPNLPLERLVIEPGERVRLAIPPDTNSGPEETNPQAFIEFVIEDTAGRPIRATVAIDDQIQYRDATQFLLVMPDPSKPTMVRVTTPGFETWEMGIRFGLKHTRRFQFPITLQPKPD